MVRSTTVRSHIRKTKSGFSPIRQHRRRTFKDWNISDLRKGLEYARTNYFRSLSQNSKYRIRIYKELTKDYEDELSKRK
jgi:hypothetical protein